MKNKLVSKNAKVIILVLIAAILTIAIECLWFNRNRIFLPQNQREVTINLDEVSSTGFQNKGGNLISIEDESGVGFEFDEKYIGKLQIVYVAQDDFQTEITSYRIGTYQKEEVKQYGRNNSGKINLMSISVNAKSNRVDIKFKGNLEIQSIKIKNAVDMNKYRMVFGFGSIMLIGMLILSRKTLFSSYENSFIVIALVCGFFYIFFTPNMTIISEDDEVHFSRAYELLDFNNSSYSTSSDQMARAQFPRGCITSKEEMSAQTAYLRENDDDVVRISDGKRYIPYNELAYVPSAIGINIAKMFNAPFDIMFKMGKIMNLLVYAITMYFAIKIMPVKKYLLFFFALLPTNISLASNYSYDPITTAFLMLGFAMFLKEYFSENKISRKWITIYSVVTIFGILPKAVYAPFILLPLLFKEEKFNNRKEMKRFKLCVALLFVALVATFALPTLLSPSVVGDARVAGTSISGQLSLIFSNITDFIRVFFDNAGKQFLEKLLGKRALVEFGNIGVGTDNVYFLSIIMLIVLAVISTKGENLRKISKALKINIIVNSLMVVGLIWVALFLAFNVVGTTVIVGIQNRYFLPILVPLLLCISIPSIKSEISPRKLNTFISIVSSMMLLSCIYEIILKVFCY